MSRLISVLRRFAHIPQILENINEGISNETRVLNEKLTEIKLAIEAFGLRSTQKNAIPVGATQAADIRLQIKPLSGSDLFSASAQATSEGGIRPESWPALPFPEVSLEEGDPVSV